MDMDVLLSSFTVLSVMVAWFKGSLFETRLMKFQALRDQGRWTGKLFSCPLCLSYHIAFWIELLFMVPLHLLQGTVWWAVALTFLPRVLTSGTIAYHAYSYRYQGD